MIIFELTFLLYLAIIVVSLYGAVLFVWWWSKTKHASEVYKYMILFFLSISFEFVTASIARVLFVTKSDTYDMFLTSTIWNIRSIPLFVVLFLIVTRMTHRVLKTLSSDMEKDDTDLDRELKQNASNLDNSLKENASNLDIRLKQNSDNLDANLRQNADNLGVKLKQNADNLDIRLKENASNLDSKPI